MLDLIEDYGGHFLIALALIFTVIAVIVFVSEVNKNNEDITPSYEFTCIDSIKYIIQNNEIKTPHYNIDGGIYTCE